MNKSKSPIQIDVDVHKMLKLHCAKNDVKIGMWVSDFIRDYLLKLKQDKDYEDSANIDLPKFKM